MVLFAVDAVAMFTADIVLMIVVKGEIFFSFPRICCRRDSVVRQRDGAVKSHC